MKYIIPAILAFLVFSQNTYAEFISGAIHSTNSERGNFGWGGKGGANLEMYSLTDASNPSRQGELRFVFGGGDFGSIRYIHYNGATWTTKLYLDKTGAVGINTGNTIPCTDCSLAVNGNTVVNGKIQSSEMLVTDTGWADYVFKDDYNLMNLKEVQTYIDENGHLPGVPSASDVAAKGSVNIGDMTKTLLEKVEELTLHMIVLKKDNDELKAKVASLLDASKTSIK